MNIQVKYSTIIVRDMEESIKFYTEVMGFAVDSQFRPASGILITLMKGRGEAMIELIEDNVHDAGFYSVGMDVENLDEVLNELRAKGTKIENEPVPTLVGKLAFIEDPNGVRIALIQHG